MRVTVNEQFDTQLILIQSLDDFADGFDSILTNLNQLLENGNSLLTVAEFHLDMESSLHDLGRDISIDLPFDVNINALVSANGNLGFVGALVLPIQSHIEAQEIVLRETLHAGISLPGANYSGDEIKDMLIRSILASPAVGVIRVSANQYLQSYINELIDFQLVINDQINIAIKAQLAKLISPLNDLIADASAELSLPVFAAEIDGGAVIEHRDISRLHLSAGWDIQPGAGIEGSKFNGELVAKRQQVTPGTTSCGLNGGVPTFHTSITAGGTMNIAGSPADANVRLGFTFDESRDGLSAYFPVALNGGITVEDEMKYDPFILRDFGFGAGIGLGEAYISAGGAGSFSGTGLDLFAFIGRTCEASVILEGDSEVQDLLEGRFQSDQPFTGFYARGSTTIPVVDSGTCLLSVSAVADIGAWITVEPTFEPGGLIGGGISGQLACIGSVRGQLRTTGAINASGDIFYAGQAFAVAGTGFDCDRGTWTSVGRSRGDDWCGTADISVGVTYDLGKWTYDADRPSAIH